MYKNLYLFACLIWTILPSFGILALLTVSRARPLAYGGMQLKGRV